MRLKYTALVFSALFAAITVTSAAHAGPKHLVVVGDSLATGLYYGLRDAMVGNRIAVLVRRTKGATGLAPVRAYDWIAAARRIKRKDNPGIIVVCLGGNDRQDMFIGSKRLKRFTKGWWAEYRRRVDTFMQVLAAGDARVFWIGLPAVRPKKMSRDYANLNAVYEHIANRHGITYIDTYALTSVGAGALSKRRLRDEDGVHFSGYGNMTLGKIILRAIKQSLASAS